jgi:hypothetical protein
MFKLNMHGNALLVLPWRYAGIGKQLVGFVNAAT